MHAPCLIDGISMAGLCAFVKIIHLYLRTADIWICWFGRFAFVKPSRLHLQTSNINASFGTSLYFSQNNLCIFQSNHPHLQTGYFDKSTGARHTDIIFETWHMQCMWHAYVGMFRHPLALKRWSAIIIFMSKLLMKSTSWRSGNVTDKVVTWRIKW